MPVTNFAAQAVTWNIGSNIQNNYIQTFEVGYGSGTATVLNTTLVNGSVRVAITGSPDFSQTRKVTFQGDFNSVVLSGLQLTEWGLFASGTIGVGSTWQREAFNPITFDGTNELQIVSTIEVIPG